MSPRHTEFSVNWPVQGAACFRSQESELVLSDVYWRWILDALPARGDDGRRLPFVEAFKSGFNDPSNLVESLPVTPGFLDLLRQVPPSKAPSFDGLTPSPGCPVPTPEQILAELTRVAGEALSSGKLEVEVE